MGFVVPHDLSLLSTLLPKSEAKFRVHICLQEEEYLWRRGLWPQFTQQLHGGCLPVPSGGEGWLAQWFPKVWGW